MITPFRGVYRGNNRGCEPAKKKRRGEEELLRKITEESDATFDGVGTYCLERVECSVNFNARQVIDWRKCGWCTARVRVLRV